MSEKPTSLRELFSGPEKWCKGWNAVDEHGVSVLPYEPTACRFCLDGAALAVYIGFYHREIKRNYLDNAVHDLFPDRANGEFDRAYVNFNDHPDTTFEDVLKVIEHAEV